MENNIFRIYLMGCILLCDSILCLCNCRTQQRVMEYLQRRLLGLDLIMYYFIKNLCCRAFRHKFKLDIVGLNTDPYFTTVGIVVKSRYTRCMYVIFMRKNKR
jgi:hypothetical protein